MTFLFHPKIQLIQIFQKKYSEVHDDSFDIVISLVRQFGDGSHMAKNDI